jgi:hypothetical protein
MLVRISAVIEPRLITEPVKVLLRTAIAVLVVANEEPASGNGGNSGLTIVPVKLP